MARRSHEVDLFPGFGMELIQLLGHELSGVVLQGFPEQVEVWIHDAAPELTASP